MHHVLLLLSKLTYWLALLIVYLLVGSAVLLAVSSVFGNTAVPVAITSFGLWALAIISVITGTY